MSNELKNKPYDLEQQTFLFAKEVVGLVHGLPRTIPNDEIGRQVVRSAGSAGANYIEANEALSRKDFLMWVKICRKEAKESAYWLKLVQCRDESEGTRAGLAQEATELMKIFNAIIEKSKKEPV